MPTPPRGPDTEVAAPRSGKAEREGALVFKPVGQRALVAASGPFCQIFALAGCGTAGIFLYTGRGGDPRHRLRQARHARRGCRHPAW